MYEYVKVVHIYTILLVGAIDEVVPPDQVLRTCKHTVAGVQQQLS